RPQFVAGIGCIEELSTSAIPNGTVCAHDHNSNTLHRTKRDGPEAERHLALRGIGVTKSPRRSTGGRHLDRDAWVLTSRTRGYSDPRRVRLSIPAETSRQQLFALHPLADRLGKKRMRTTVRMRIRWSDPQGGGVFSAQ